ncbi:hypothetical protein SDC9_203275 [bioreactor metagenome]|uniref:Uncharacterized protein n=1 Tax=bioreactor metagenome TaxID=1076179 RepID=A0A645IW72_9ZZZZ
MISRRPSNMLAERMNFAASGIWLKLPNELTLPKPGPTFPSVAMDADKAVIPSIPMAASSSVVSENVRI